MTGTRVALDPLALPPETDARFALLVAAAALFALNTGGLIGFAVLPEAWFELSSVDIDGDLPPEVYFERSQAAYGAAARGALVYLAPPLATLAVVVAAAQWRYRSHPARLIKRLGLRPPRLAKEHAVAAVVARLADAVGTARPRVLIAPRLSTEAQAFGVTEPLVRVDGGLVRAWATDPDLVTAVLRHEIAHVALGDVPRAYGAEAWWWATLRFAVAPFVATLAFFVARRHAWPAVTGAGFDGAAFATRTLPEVALLVVGLALATALIALARGHLLQRRELYADWAAARAGSRDALSAAFAAEAATSTPANRWRCAVATHPSAQTRAATLADPNRLFSSGGLQPFLVGALVAWAVAGLLQLLVPAAGAVFSGTLAAASALAVFANAQGAVGALTLAIIVAASSTGIVLAAVLAPPWWVGRLVTRTLTRAAARDGVAAAFEDARTPWLPLRTALAVAVGLEIGFLATPFAFYSPVRAVMPGAEGFPFALWFSATVTTLVLVTGLAAAAAARGRVAWARARRAAAAQAPRAWTVVAVALLVLVATSRLLTGIVRTGPEAALLVRFGGAAAVVALAALVWASIGLAVRAAAPAPCPRCALASRGSPQCPRCGTVLAGWLMAPHALSERQATSPTPP